MDFYTNVQMTGNNIFYRGVRDGKRVRQKIRYQPSLYVPKNNSAPADIVSPYRGLHGESLIPINFDSIREARNYLKQYEYVANAKIYGIHHFDTAYVADTYQGEIQWDLTHIKVAYIDIEVSSENGFPHPEDALEEVTAITLFTEGAYHVFATGSYIIPDLRTDIHYNKCSCEAELLGRFIAYWKDHYPDVITGWNIGMFDIPYLVNRIRRLDNNEGMAEVLSPWGQIFTRERTIFGRDMTFFELVGVSTLDYIDLYRKFSATPSQESYKLDYIASVELGTSKIDYSEFQSLYHLYRENFQKFIDYNIRDVELVYKLEDKLRLIELAITLAYDSKVNFEDVFSQTRMWDSIIYNHLKSKSIIVPPKKKIKKGQSFRGAYVKETLEGFYEWVASFDLTSLYPKLMIQYNISPEMLIDLGDPKNADLAALSERINVEDLLSHTVDTEGLLEKHNVTMTPNGQFFDRSRQGFMPELMETMFDQRSHYKKLMMQAKKEKEKTTDPDAKLIVEKTISRYNNLQSTKKICLNSCYGVMGSEYFRFFDTRLAEAVTMSGQLSIQWVGQAVNKLINEMSGTEGVDYIIASDTDSIYINMAKVVGQYMTGDPVAVIDKMDEICKKNIAPLIEKVFADLAIYLNAYKPSMEMKREALANRGIWVGRKTYFLNVYDSEGIRFKQPEVKVTGMVAIKSSTPQVCRKKIKEIFNIILKGTENELKKLVEDFKKEFFGLLPQDIAFPRSVNHLHKYSDSSNIYKKGTQAQIRGALVFNHHLKQLGLTKKYETIKEGEKIKFLYLKEPNKLQTDVIGFTTILPEEFDIHQHIDYNVMYQKTFLKAFEDPLRKRGWSLQEPSILSRFFEDD